MMYKFCVILFLFFSGQMIGQDTIVKIDNERIPANITQVNNTEVKYRRSSMPDGPDFTLNKTKIWKIIYRSGEVEVITPAKTIDQSGYGGLMHKSLVSISATDLVFGLLSVSYELNLVKDRFAIRVPVSSGISAFSSTVPNYNDFFYYSRFKMISFGTDFLYYPTGQAHVGSYYIGLSLEGGLVKQYQYIWDFPPYTPTNENIWYTGFGLTNGLLLNVNERINISTYLTLGMKASTNNSYNNNTFGLCRAGVNMGIRFGKPSLKNTQG